MSDAAKPSDGRLKDSLEQIVFLFTGTRKAIHAPPLVLDSVHEKIPACLRIDCPVCKINIDEISQSASVIRFTPNIEYIAVSK
jgi:heterodisulfide reductase subunit B